MESNKLPPFPVDDGTLDLLSKALNPGPEAERSSVGEFLELMSEMGGSDPRAVDHVMEQGIDYEILMMRDQSYHVNDVLSALIAEVRRLREQPQR